MFGKNTFLAGIVVFAASAGTASAVSISIDTDISVADGVASRTAFLDGSANSRILVEDFESFTACTGGNPGDCSSTPIVSNIGNFFAIGDEDTGASPVAPFDEAVIRDTAQFGRFNTTAGGSQYLDSNDKQGIRLEMPGDSGIPMFDRIAFFLMDIDDVASLDFRITARELDTGAGPVAVTNMTKWASGVLHLVKIDFGMNVSDARIRMLNTVQAEKDGFGVDDFYVAAVPLPAAGLLLLGAIGGLGAMRMRKRKMAS